MSTEESYLKPAKGSVRNRKRVGRGNASGWGGECGRGHKGQKSRSGYSKRSGFEGGQTPLYRRLPKLRGTGNSKRSYSLPINLNQIDHYYSDGEVVSPETLYQKGLIKLDQRFKILSEGSLTKKVSVQTYSISSAASAKLATQSIEVVLINS